jgi:DNA-binding NtrC family response regulator
MISRNHHVPGTTTAVSSSQSAPLRSILLVDDESTLRSALRRYFMRRGWQVREAEDGEEARALLLDAEVIGGGFDVVITDVRMPRLSGLELHEMVARVDANVSRRFVFSTGDTGDEAAVAYLARTRCPLVQKPFELATLLATVERVVIEAAPPAVN